MNNVRGICRQGDQTIFCQGVGLDEVIQLCAQHCLEVVLAIRHDQSTKRRQLLLFRQSRSDSCSPVSIHRVCSCLDLLDIQDLQRRLQYRSINRRLGEKDSRDRIRSELIRHGVVGVQSSRYGVRQMGRRDRKRRWTQAVYDEVIVSS